jgi:peptide chain release factor 3
MNVNHPRTGKSLKLAQTYTFFAENREITDEAFAGDIIGLPGNRHFTIGDTVTSNGRFNFDPIPRFPPEHFGRLINLDISKQKQFLKGTQQLATEGAMQVLHETDAQRRDPILAVVGVLQFEVVQARLEDEYGVKTRLEMLPHSLARYVEGPQEEVEKLPWRYGLLRVQDENGRLIALFNSEHELGFYSGRHAEVVFKATL